MANPHPRTDQLVKTQFKKGHKKIVGSGRPRRDPQTVANEAALQRKAPKDLVAAWKQFGLERGATIADVLALCLVKAGLKGNVAAIKELRESVGGKAEQRIHLFTQADHTVSVQVQFDTPPGLSAPSANMPAVEDAETIDVQAKLVEDTDAPTPAPDDTEKP